jgi:hypothetical protein
LNTSRYPVRWIPVVTSLEKQSPEILKNKKKSLIIKRPSLTAKKEKFLVNNEKRFYNICYRMTYSRMTVS